MKIVIFFIMFIVSSSAFSYVSVKDAIPSIHKYGLKIHVPFCIQKKNSLQCDFHVKNITKKDIDFHMGINQLLVDYDGEEYDRVSFYNRKGKLLVPVGSHNGGPLASILVPGVTKVYRLVFHNIDSTNQRKFIPRIYSDWLMHSCSSRYKRCPNVFFSNIPIK